MLMEDEKLAVSYCNLEFQAALNDPFMDSYIWDIGNSIFIRNIMIIQT